MDDKMIVEKMGLGDTKMLKNIYSKYHHEFISLIIRKFPKLKYDDAEDIFNDAMVSLYENITKGKLNRDNLTSTLKTYFFQIGINKTLAFVKKSSRFNDIQVSIQKEQSELFDDNQEEEIEFDNKLKLVEGCMDKMGNPCKTLLELYYFHKCRMVEIAERLGYNTADVAKNQKAKCMKRLRKMLVN